MVLKALQAAAGRLKDGVLFVGHLFRLGAEKLIRDPTLPAKQTARDAPKLPHFVYFATKNGFGNAWAAVVWAWTQFAGLWNSTVEYFAGFAINDVLPPSLRQLGNWFIGIIPQAFGVRDTTRRQQINANAVLIGVTLLTGFVTAGAAWALIGVWAAFLLFAFFFRGTPAGDSYWHRFRRRLPVKKNYNVPAWRGK